MKGIILAGVGSNRDFRSYPSNDCLFCLPE